MLLDCLYLLAGLLLTPYFLFRRFIKGKRSAPLRQRLGHVPERPAAQRVWIHAVSVGEAAAAETLVMALRARLPQLDLVISTTTTTGQEIAAKKYGADNVFHYPHDLSFAVRRTLDRVKPSLLVLMELEVWPNMTTECARRGIPVVVVNARVTERAARRYQRFWFLVGPAFRRVRRWLAQSEEYAARLKELGVAAERIEITGNMKYDAIDLALPDDAERARVRESLGISADARVLVGGSTHPGEEAALLAAYAQLRNGACPGLRLILVPRHPERSSAVEAEITAAGFLCQRLSTLEGATQHSAPSTQHSVLLVDTVGKLKTMYKAADVAFVGGSLIPRGGQNVMEPCGLGVPVIHGPHMHNFNEAMEILRGCNGSVEVSRETLSAEIEKLLANPASAKAMAARARESFLQRQGATEKAAEYLCGILVEKCGAKV